MKNQTQETTAFETNTNQVQKNPQINPRKAATKLKEALNNVEVMKKRFKVLQVQDQYNRYKTLDHEKRIKFHSEVHQILEKDRQVLKKSLEKIDETTKNKQKSGAIRKQLKQRLEQAQKNYLIERVEGYHTIKKQFHEHETQIEKIKRISFLENQERKKSILEQEQRQKQLVERYRQNKVHETRINKSLDSSTLQAKASQKQKQLTNLMQYEQQLIKKNAQSLQASQIMKRKFVQVFVPPRPNSIILPEIRVRTNNSHSSTNKSELTIT